MHGITPGGISSACWRGYYCTYAVNGDRLLLQDLHMGLTEEDAGLAQNGAGPAIQGILPRYDDQEYCWGYSPLQMPIGFTGGLLLGRDFIRELYVHMGFHPAWKYRQVYELVFQDGHLLASDDRTAQLEESRSHLKPADLKPGRSSTKGDIADWIDRTFSLDYDR